MTNQQKLNELTLNIEKWAVARNLIDGSTPQKQMLKLMEEFGELCSGVAKNKTEVIKDSIGDCFVVSVILCNQIGLADDVDFYADGIIKEYQDGKYDYTNVTEQLLDGIFSLGAISNPINNGWEVPKEWMELFFMNLVLVALLYGFKFNDCVQHAYDQIKDRKGRMIDGVFVKEEDFQND